MNVGCIVRIAALTALILPLGSAQAIDFRFRPHTVRNYDGDSVDYYFKHQTSRIFYRVPLSWTWEDSSTEFVARPPLPSRGRLVIQAMPPFPTLPPPGTKEGIEAYLKHFAEHMPAGSSDVQEIDAQVEKLGGRELPATRATFSYSWGGRPRGQTVIYAVLRPDLWLVIRIDSLKEDFSSVNAAALRSLEGFTEEIPSAAPNSESRAANYSSANDTTRQQQVIVSGAPVS